MDTEATRHLTPEMENLSIHSDYNGPDEITIENGNTLPINHIGNSICSLHNHSFTLNDILHVPDACANLLSVSAFSTTNRVSIEFFPDHFEIKDLRTKDLLLFGPNDHGLYSLFLDIHSSSSPVKTALKCSLQQWHARLGHASLPTVRKALQQSNISFVFNNVSSLCELE